MPAQLLAHEVNRFNVVEIRADFLPQNLVAFHRQLTDSLHAWKISGHSAVWLEVPIENAALIAPSTKLGFVFHHSTERSLTLLYTFKEGMNIPTYATHYVGVGGVVLNAQQELLVVNEWHRRDLSRPYYKLPGGALTPGEHLVDGVRREVFEETGVDATFEALIGFRHWHGFRWDKSDMYFICRLRANGEKITIQQSEIEDAKWMPLNEYLTSEYVSAFNQRVVRAALDSPGLSTEDIDDYSDPSRFEFFMPC